MSAKTLEAVVAAFPQEVKEKYDFTNATYTSALKPIEGVICPTHGVFSQYAAQLRKNGAGCPACGAKQRAKSQRLTPEAFVAMCAGAHGGKYTYENTHYVKMVEKVEVTCKLHGGFTLSPIKHLYSAQGCPSCGAQSRGKRK